MNITTRQMQAFLAVSHTGSFTRAAARLHITQSGLSAMTRALEVQFGTRLFDRTTRSVVLTAAGRALVPAVERALAELEAAQARVARAGEDAASLLTVAATPMVASSLMPSVLAAFDNASSGVSIRMRDGVGPGIQALVAQGEADLGLGVFNAPYAGVDTKPLMRFHLIAVFKPGTIDLRQDKRSKATLPSASWIQLKEMPMLTLSIPDITQQLVGSHLAAIGHSHRDSRSYDSLHTMVAMAATGHGVAVVPSFALNACLRYGAQCARVADPSATIQWSYALRKGSDPHPAAAAFRRTLVGVAREVCHE